MRAEVILESDTDCAIRDSRNDETCVHLSTALCHRTNVFCGSSNLYMCFVDICLKVLTSSLRRDYEENERGVDCKTKKSEQVHRSNVVTKIWRLAN